MGEIAALATSLAWSFSSIQFTLAGRRVGAGVLNRTRLALAVLYLSLAHLALYGEVWPVHAELFRWSWLGLSGVVGLVLGDACLFQAFVLIGPRRSLLLMTLSPVISGLVAWLWLGETLHLVEVGAVLLTVGGIAWVVSERRLAQEAESRGDRSQVMGVLLALGGALGQSLGLVFSKQGLVGDFASLSATLIRMLVACGVIWLLTLVGGQLDATWLALRDKKAWGLMIGGALIGPFAGVWLSMIAVQRAPVGIASTLMALSPILLIPLEHWVFGERISLRAVAGTLVAMVGAALIFLT